MPSLGWIHTQKTDDDKCNGNAASKGQMAVDRMHCDRRHVMAMGISLLWAQNCKAVVIRPELQPNIQSYDPNDPNLRLISNMVQDALNAEDVREEERKWTQIITKVKQNWSDANWAPDALCRAYGNRGNSKARQGNFSSAVQDYNQSMTLCPGAVDPVLNRGVAYEAMREYQLAIEDYEAVLAVDKSDPAAWNNFGNAHAGLQNWDTAADAYKKAASLSSGFSFASANYAVVLFQQGKEEEAIRQCRKILLKYPSLTDARAALAVALWLRGDRSESEAQWFRVDDPRYSDVQWLKEKRRWPPKLVQGMQEFIQIVPPRL